MFVQNWKFVALPVPEIIRGTEKNPAVPGYVHVPFSTQCLRGFCSHGLEMGIEPINSSSGSVRFGFA